MANEITVTVSQGILRGKKSTTESGGPLICFLGIPYAKPPVGALRFKPPEPPEVWNGVRDATEYGPVCIQVNIMMGSIIEGSEDCLYLNVYTTELPSRRRKALKPVMVWIHGGGFVMGSGNKDLYGPDFLVDAGVMVVTINYRLGIMGFLSLCNDAVPGNMGLKDQVAALRWIQQNIKEFGGDPKNVTIFGESAGGASVHYHLLSPMSKGLFKQAIMQSGCALNPWAFTQNRRSKAFQLAKHLGCDTEDLDELLNFFINIEASKLVEAVMQLSTRMERSQGLNFYFVPTTEPNIIGQEAFLSRDPHVLIREGKFQKIPLMTGFNSSEGIILLRDIQKNPSILQSIYNDFQRIIPEHLQGLKDAQYLQDLARRIKTLYFSDKPLSQDTLVEYMNMHTDMSFAVGMQLVLKQQVSATAVPVYFYKFTFDGCGFIKKLVGCENLPGACHGDDICYLFRGDLFNVELDPDSPDMLMRKRMVKLWTNFAKTGKPVPKVDADLPVVWRPYTLSNPSYLKIDVNLSMEQERERKNMDFWEKLYHSKL